MSVDFDFIALSPNAEEFDLTKIQQNCKFPSQEEEDKCFEESRAYLKKAAVEIIDIEKPYGPMHVELHLGSSNQNLITSLGLPSITSEAAKQREEYEKRSSSKNYSLQTAASKIKSSAINGFLNLIPSAQAWELSWGYRLFVDKVSAPSEEYVFVYLHDGGLYNRPHINDYFTMASLQNKDPINNNLQYKHPDDYEYYKGKIENVIYWDAFTLNRDKGGQSNDQILQLLQSQVYNCTFVFDQEKAKKLWK